MDPHRSERLAEAMREELEEIINYELSDPRISDVAVTEVLLAGDLRQAVVRFSLGGTPEAAQETMRALENARKHVRRLLASRLDLYRIPELRFEPDSETASPDRVRQLLRRIRKGRPKTADPEGGVGKEKSVG
jgi:ribosome-binding factor A